MLASDWTIQMTEFKTELQKLIDEAAWNICEYDHDKDKASFKAGCEFLMPLIEELMKDRNNYINLCETHFNTDSMINYEIELCDKDLLNLLRGER